MPKLRPLPSRDIIKVFQKLGFEISKRNPGDHIAMRKPGGIRPLIIPDKREVPVFIILNNIRSAKITREDFLRTLADL